jgi:hypothetical protein
LSLVINEWRGSVRLFVRQAFIWPPLQDGLVRYQFSASFGIGPSSFALWRIFWILIEISFYEKWH